MSRKGPDANSDQLWAGRPWITPAIAVRSVVAIILAVGLTWLEVQFGITTFPVLGIQLILWTYLLILLGWLVTVLRHLLLRASNAYRLQRNGLEIETGLVSKRAMVLSATGFSDLELIRSASGRILNVGEIIVRTDSGREVRMKGVRNPVLISNMVREVMTKPLVRLDRNDQADTGRKG